MAEFNPIPSPLDLLRSQVVAALSRGTFPVRVELTGFHDSVRDMVRLDLVQRGYTVRHVIQQKSWGDGGGYSIRRCDHWSITPAGDDDG